MSSSLRNWTAVFVGSLASLLVGHAENPFQRYACLPGQDDYLFCDTGLSLAERVDDLISRLELDEKPWLMEARYSPLGNITRLGIPQYDWGGNCIHGVQSRCGVGTANDTRCPTSFPNPNLLGATFNESVWKAMGQVIGTELRSLWKQGVGENHKSGLPPIGLDCWSPTVNVVRDPRWGRNYESPSEDPLVLSRFGVAVTRGVQEGEDPRYLQAVVTLKHFVANSLEGNWPGPGGPAEYPGTGLCPGGTCTRHTMDPNISAYDLASTYLVAFKASVVEGGALGIMCSYNSVNGVPSCANDWLLQEKLRKEWGFKGYVTGDSGAVEDIARQHHYARTMEEAVAMAVKAGTDVQSGPWSHNQPWSVHGAYIDLIPEAVRKGALAEEAVDEALRHTLSLRFRLGLFDPPDGQVYERTSPDVVRSPEHIAAAIDASEQGLVLLQNEELEAGGARALPIRSGKIAVIGPHATSRGDLLGSYLGQICPGAGSENVDQYYCVQSLVEALSELAEGETSYAPGLSNVSSSDTSLFAEAMEVARQAEHVVLCLGLGMSLENEGHDRHSITLPEGQLLLLAAMASVGRPVTLVLLNGGAVAMSAAKAQATAIVEAWYPGYFGAKAVARALLGHTNRWGKLPVTIYDESWTQEADMLEFDMSKAPGRTYRYYSGTPLWPFGHGLSYTSFELKLVSETRVQVLQRGGSTATVSVEVRNAGTLAGDEVVMAFFQPLPSTLPAGSRAQSLKKQLFGFQRVTLVPGAIAKVEFSVSHEVLAMYSDNGDRVSYRGGHRIWVSNGLQEVAVVAEVDGEDAAQPLVLEAWKPFEASETLPPSRGGGEVSDLVV